MMKNFEADTKRLKAIMSNYEEKKSDLTEAEKKERNDVVVMTRDCFNLFKMAYNDQTSRFERGNLIDISSGVGEMSSMIQSNIS